VAEQVFYSWRPRVDPDWLASEIYMYTRMLDLPNMNDECEAWLIARLNCCMGHELTSDGIPWLDLCQVLDPFGLNWPGGR
jgi:hypothetical protein